MRITFKKIEIHNFMSYVDETFDFDNIKGLNLVCGKNNDIPGSKNAVGKCLDPETKIQIEVNSSILNDL